MALSIHSIRPEPLPQPARSPADTSLTLDFYLLSNFLQHSYIEHLLQMT